VSGFTYKEEYTYFLCVTLYGSRSDTLLSRDSENRVYRYLEVIHRLSFSLLLVVKSLLNEDDVRIRTRSSLNIEEICFLPKDLTRS
jgi:hypothetical protein